MCLDVPSRYDYKTLKLSLHSERTEIFLILQYGCNVIVRVRSILDPARSKSLIVIRVAHVLDINNCDDKNILPYFMW